MLEIASQVYDNQRLAENKAVHIIVMHTDAVLVRDFFFALPEIVRSMNVLYLACGVFDVRCGPNLVLVSGA